MLVPFAKEPIPDPDFASDNPDDDNTGEPWSKQQQRAFVGLAGESRLFDGNSSYFRVQAGGGPAQLVTTGEAGRGLLLAPALPDRGRAADQPARRATGRSSGPTSRASCRRCPTCTRRTATPAEDEISPQSVRNDAATQAREAKAQLEWTKLVDHMRRTAQGLPTFDPLVYKGPLEKEMLERLGLIRLDSGKLAEAPKATEVSE